MGAFFTHLITALVTLALVAAFFWFGGPKVAGWALAQHSVAAVDHAAVGAGARARDAETASSGRATAACMKEASSAYRAGLAASHITAPSATPGLIQGGDLATMWGQQP